MNAAKWLAIAARLIFLLVVLAPADKLIDMIFALGLLLVTAPLLFLGQRNKQFYIIDAGLILLFVVPATLDLNGVLLQSSIFGLDKLFHFTVGILLCWLASLLLAKERPIVFWIALCMSVAIVALGWEVYEWLLFLLAVPELQLTLVDTVLDVVAVLLGSLAALLFRR